MQRILSLTALGLLLLVGVNAAFATAQRAFFGEHLIPSAVLKLLLGAVIVAGAVGRYREGGRAAFNAAAPWPELLAVVTAGLLIPAAALLAQGVKPVYLGHSYLSYYGVVFLLMMAAIAGLRLEWRAIERTLMIVGLLVGILGIAQAVAQSPLIPVGNQLVGRDASAEFYGYMRPFSLFATPYAFGMFMSFVWLVALAGLVRERNAGFPWLFLLAGAVALLAIGVTLNRSAWLQAGIATVFFLVMRFKPDWQVIRRYAPLMHFAAIGMALFLVTHVDFLKQQTLLSNETLSQRVYQWGIYMDVWMDAGPLQWFAGMGMFQHYEYSKILIDSTYIALLVHTGILGLLAVLYFFSRIWTLAVQMYERARAPHALAVLAFLAPFPVIMIVQIELLYYPLALMLLVMGEGREQ